MPGMPCFPSGPKSLEELIDWPTDFARRMAFHDAMHGGCCVSKLKGRMLGPGAVVTTTYSGIGCAETAASMCVEAVAGVSCDGVGDGITFFSACEKEEVQQECLKRGPHLHVFKDVMDRVPQVVAKTLMMMASDAVQLFSTDLKQVKSEPEDDCDVKAWVLEQKVKRGNKLLVDSLKMLDTVVMNDFAPCLKHPGQQCPLTPRAVPELANLLWVEVAGPVCKPWCSVGLKRQWLDITTPACLTWVVSSRFFQPDAILLENSPFFVEGVVSDLLNGISLALMEDALSIVPKPIQPLQHATVIDSAQAALACSKRRRVSRKSRGTKFDAEKKYSCQPFQFCPSALGFPIHRERKYVWYVWLGSWSLPTNMPLFSEIFFRHCELPGSVYFDAISPEVRALKTKGMPDAAKATSSLEPEGTESSCDDGSFALTATCRARAATYLVKAQREGLVDMSGRWRRRACIVNLNWSSGYAGLPAHDMVPTLLQASKLYDLVKGTEFQAVEHFLIMGFPLAGSAGSERWAHAHKFSELVSLTCGSSLTGHQARAATPLSWAAGRVLSDREIRIVQGQGMHLGAVGAMLLLGLAYIEEL